LTDNRTRDARSIIALINAILVVGWLLAAALFFAAARQFRAA